MIGSVPEGAFGKEEGEDGLDCVLVVAIGEERDQPDCVTSGERGNVLGLPLMKVSRRGEDVVRLLVSLGEPLLALERPLLDRDSRGVVVTWERDGVQVAEGLRTDKRMSAQATNEPCLPSRGV